MVDEFLKAMAPIMAANLLTVGIVACYVVRERREREGNGHSIDTVIACAFTIMGLLFLYWGMTEWSLTPAPAPTTAPGN